MEHQDGLLDGVLGAGVGLGMENSPGTENGKPGRGGQGTIGMPKRANRGSDDSSSGWSPFDVQEIHFDRYRKWEEDTYLFAGVAHIHLIGYT